MAAENTTTPQVCEFHSRLDTFLWSYFTIIKIAELFRHLQKFDEPQSLQRKGMKTILQAILENEIK